jgi:ubiquitin-conjugating enzyme E2 W
MLAIARGGAMDLSEEDTDTDGLQAMRRFVRALLSMSERVSPGLSKTVKGIFRLIEDVFGVELVPKKHKKLKRKKSSKAKSSVGVKKSPEKSSAKDRASSSAGRKAKSTSTSEKAKPKASTVPKGKVHVKTDLKSTSPNYRIQQELKKFLADPPPNLTVTVGKNIRVWIVTMKGAKSTIYEGEIFRLRISFPAAYPTVPPSVYFLPPNIPVHEHVYTNGDICLSLLGKDWRPTMTAQSIAVSILSILSSAQSKSLPMDNAQHSHRKPGQYQENWVYHDDNVRIDENPIICLPQSDCSLPSVFSYALKC